ncbi:MULTISPECIES: rhodanese-like domain-containing protein [unclassified Wenzhouxiangella]|uniref:rhodanese-like domain-containing protein n=1 Tax=unclassified Wenzhouxiangella TaxID=2613841 RepID=UPI000E32B289|nr:MULTISPECIES: rhodanese-like domain-containing protein [unclassified Wenzhouxiangella]RFF26835.1 rhodanese-like domain-containing protein [Wenzhouxiangella sp. 15181]RFP68512.1 rhodanese-like domain-containing protein [Wenzhouxiangella sp. 15190]
MEQVLEFIGNHPLLTGALGVAIAVLIGYEVSRLFRQWKELGTLEAVQLLNREDPVVLDVSNSTDYAKGHIQGAMHMPPSRIEAGNQQLLKFKDRPVLVYCRNNQVAPQMAGRLVKLGFTNVNVLGGGLTQWISDHQPVTRHKGAGKPEEGKGKRRKKSKDGKKSEAKETE